LNGQTRYKANNRRDIIFPMMRIHPIRAHLTAKVTLGWQGSNTN
jgi:hypothetical protein